MGSRFSLDRLMAQKKNMQRLSGHDYSGFNKNEVKEMAVKVKQVCQYLDSVNKQLVKEIGSRISYISNRLSELNERLK
jgi:phage-related protein